MATRSAPAAGSRGAREQSTEARGPAAYAAEVLGTAILVLAICGTVSASAGAGDSTDLLGVAVAHALALMVLVYALGGTSGGHFNPAVTAALWAIGQIRSRDAGIYVACQLLGGVIAGVLVLLLFNDAGDAVDYGAAAVNGDVLSGGAPLLALLAEALGAFVLVLAIMGTAVNPRGEAALAGVVIGGALGLAVLIFGPATGGSFNPARWFGPALVSGAFDDFWLYVIGPVIGGVAAAVGYRLLVLDRRGVPAERPVDNLDAQ